MKQENEFYIGWQDRPPSGFARHTRSVVFVLVVLVVVVAVVLSLQQRKFSTASFEFGQLTEVRGVYQEFPVPALRVTTQRDAWGNAEFITIPLVGYGKFGGEGVVDALERKYNITLDQKEVVLKGTLLYSDGKTLLQVDENDDPLIRYSSEQVLLRHVSKELGNVKLVGEILDPKCYFGVMKPGNGKPHRDCAIRCIAGGMSPVFWVRNEKAESDYYLILDENGKKMNEQLKDHIAEPVQLEARAVQYDDWIILFAKKNGVRRTGGLSWFKINEENISCRPAD